MSQIWFELRAALRRLSRSRGFAVAVIATLGTGIALQTAVTTVVSSYLVRPLPYPEADRLYNLRMAGPQQSPPRGLSSLDWTSLSDLVEHAISWDLDVFYMLGGEYPERAPGAWVTTGFMQGLGIRAAMGRSFGADDFVPGGPQVALISHDLWRNRFGGDTAAVGRRFSAYVSDRPEDPELFTIVGVLPPGFWHLNPYTQVLTPLRGSSYPYLMRLRPEVPPALAERRIDALVRDGGLTIPDGWRPALRPTHREYTTAARPMLYAVGAAVTLVFLVASANVALLLVLRGIRRRREMAVRAALGAGLARLTRMLLAESFVLLAGAATLGVVLSSVALRSLAPAIEQQIGRRVPGGVSALTIDWRVLVIIGVILAVVAAALTLAPLAGVRGAGIAALRERRDGGGGGGRTRSTLITLEVAGSLALLVACGLMLRTIDRMLDVDLGVRTDQVVSATLAVREQSYPERSSRTELYERLLAALHRTDGVEAVALATPSPLASFEPDEVQVDRADEAPKRRAAIRPVAGDFFGLLGIPAQRGRVFAHADRGTTEPVAIVSASAARALWPGVDPIGRAIRLTAPDDTVAVWRTVVGVVSDVRQSPTDTVLCDVYVPLLQVPGRFVAIVLRGRAGAPPWLNVLRRTVRDIDPTIALSPVEVLDAAVKQQLARPRFLARLFAAFGIFATTLGVMGLSVVIAYAVKQREYEIAVRMAVGARGRSIMALFLRDGARVVLAGVVLGAAGAVGLGRLLRSQLFGVQPVDGTTLGVAALLLTAAAIAAIWWPARRASRTDPVIALRSE